MSHGPWVTCVLANYFQTNFFSNIISKIANLSKFGSFKKETRQTNQQFIHKIFLWQGKWLHIFSALVLWPDFLVLFYGLVVRTGLSAECRFIYRWFSGKNFPEAIKGLDTTQLENENQLNDFDLGLGSRMILLYSSSAIQYAS